MTAKGKTRIGRGLFASPNKDLSKIIESQDKLLQGLDSNLRNLDNYNLCRSADLIDLVKKMLDKDPM